MPTSGIVAAGSQLCDKRWYSVLPIYGLALLGLFALDALAFRTDWYRQRLEPQSYAGTVEQMLLRVDRASSNAGIRRVIVLGDSRIAEGFSPKVAAARIGSNSVEFVNAAVPGSTPRCWNYFVHWMHPEGLAGSTVIIPVDDFDDEDGAWDWADRGLDNALLAARLSLVDVPEYVSSFRSFPATLQAAIAVILRGSALRQDVQAFVEAPVLRLEHAKAAREQGWKWVNDYGGNEGTLRGLAVDWVQHQVRVPDNIGTKQREAISAALFRERLSQTGRYREYRLHWFRSITTYLRARNANPIFVSIPRGPIWRAGAGLAPGSALAAIDREGLATLVPEDRFSSLERPDYFFDALHLNRLGRERFTAELVDYLMDAGAIRKK